MLTLLCLMLVVPVIHCRSEGSNIPQSVLLIDFEFRVKIVYTSWDDHISPKNGQKVVSL